MSEDKEREYLNNLVESLIGSNKFFEVARRHGGETEFTTVAMSHIYIHSLLKMTGSTIGRIIDCIDKFEEIDPFMEELNVRLQNIDKPGTHIRLSGSFFLAKVVWARLHKISK